MSQKNLSNIISQLQSDKVKARQEALALIRDAFKTDDLIDTLAGNTKEWHAIFSALFAAVMLERATCLKKGYDKATPASLTRLEKAGATVREVTERSATQMNKKVVRHVLQHLIDTMVYKGRLLPEISVNYVKAILAVCSYRPHLEHLDPERWISLVSLAFAAILEESLKDTRGFAEDEYDEPSDSAMEIEQESEDVDDEELTSSRKRRRRSPSRPSVQSDPPSVDVSITSRKPSVEQTDFMTLLVLLLRYPDAPYGSPGVAQKILNRLHRFFVMFPTSSNAHPNAIVAINLVVSHVELNMIHAVAQFGLKIWTPLLSYWNTKEKNVKQEAVVAMTTLFPLVTRPDLTEVPKYRVRERVAQLYTCLENDVDDIRSGFEGLPLDSLLLRLRDTDAEKRVFEADTFHFGFQFAPSQALSWTILELYADCAKILHQFSETFGSPVKRRRIETPLSNLLTRIKDVNLPCIVRSNNLQALLFIIDRHWAAFHDALQQEVATALLRLLVHEEPTLQSWTFLCLAAITSAEGTITDEAIDWDSIWDHAVRRTNVLNVCRAACHAAHALLASKRLPMHRVLADIEAISRDLVVQGPTFPYDTVCAFLCDCLRIASQDMRLHRLQLADKVLSWLAGTWNMAGSDLRAKMPAHTVGDVLTLLEVTCGLSKLSQVTVRYFLPDCTVVEVAIARHQTAAIRLYLLHARLPPFRPPIPSSPPPLTVSDPRPDGTPLAAPSPRDIKVSAFLLTSLERLYETWESPKDLADKASPPKIRRTLDAVVVALSFQASLVCNGTQSNRRVLQAACKLVTFVTPYLKLTRWKPYERALILLGLEPLISDGEPRREDDPWDVMLGPVKGSGVKRSTLIKLSSNVDGNTSESLSPRRELQTVLWQSADVQDTFEHVMTTLRHTLRVVAVPFQDTAHPNKGGDADDPDFTPIQVANSESPAAQGNELRHANQLCIQICIAFLTVAPILQSGRTNATRDKELTDLLLGCEPSAFLALGPEFFQAVRNKHMHLGVSTAERFLDRLEDLLSRTYAYTRGVATKLLAIEFLHGTSHIWIQPAASDSKLSRSVRLLISWFSSLVQRGDLGSWRIRDRLVCFLDHYIAIDPHEAFLSPAAKDPGSQDEDEEMQPDQDPSGLPSRILPKMADDDDTRVRFRVAVANGKLLCTTEITNDDPMHIYDRVKVELSLKTEDWEHMLTRFLHLGNAMVVSSAVRRGPYWHLLEVGLYETAYTTAVEAVVYAVAERLGLPDMRSLFEAYASQLVRSVIDSNQEFFRFPPSLLGYTDRRECARATFALLAPMVLEAGGDSDMAEARQRMFEDYCNKAQKSVSEGLFECFADVVGIRIVYWTDMCHDDQEGIAANVAEHLAYQIDKLATEARNTMDPNAVVRQNLDRIVFAILRTVRDEDHSRDGTILQALRSGGRSERAIATFTALTSYRKPEDFKMHRPNLPAFSALTVLRSLNWLHKNTGNKVFTTPIIYHVLHHLLAAIGNSLLVNEQMRLLHALSIWISINGSSFRDVTLLRTLLRGAVIFLSQSDLAHFAQGILGWVLGHYRSLESLEPTFPDLLGRIARIAHDYSRTAGDPILNTLGNELLDWIEKQAFALYEVDLIRPQILNALPLWPRQPCGKLALRVQELNQSQSLSDILQDKHVTSGKFRLVRRLRDLADTPAYTRDQFCNQDFWHLKNCIPPHGQLQDEDIDAFVGVLFKNAAQMAPLSNELITSTSAAMLHQRASCVMRHGGKQTFQVVSPRRSIIVTLFEILSTDVASQIHGAYTTLRLLFALPIPELEGPKDWPREYRDEISYLRSSPLPTVPASTRSLEELQTSDLFSIRDFSRWVCEVTLLLNDVLAGTDEFYAQLSSSVHSDSAFATQMLPVLVHGILLCNRDGVRETLSNYFSSILREEGASPQCCHAVVEVVLHLRNFEPPRSEPPDPLAHDKWLGIDFRLLSRGAMSCGAYTTALLFLELATDYSSSAAKDDTIAEEILYDIYNHIEEPDGFYAIKSNDVRGFLTRRFHHEGQWDKAFQFHGADFASGLHGSRGAEGIYQSFHSNGFDRLAISVLQSSNPGAAGTATDSSEFGYELAWRSEMWDLPEPLADRQAGSALYSALRAIHRDRDHRTVDVLLRNALHQEMSRLHNTGNEDMVGIRARAQTLMCLGEIRKWRGVTLQEKLATGAIALESWTDFVDISPEFDFKTLESIVATRMSLLRSTKQREQREQLGDLESPLTIGLKRLEQKCLVRLSKAARFSEHSQVALNASIHAQHLEYVPTFGVSEEFANVLWLQKEHKLAVDYLKGLVPRTTPQTEKEVTKMALVLSRLGTWSAEACLQKPTDIREQYFHRATTSILRSKSQEVDSSMDPALAVVFHQYALFAEEQYHAILRSPDVSRLKVYVERKRQEIEQLKESMQSMPSSSRKSELSFHQKKAEALLGEDVAQFSGHTESQGTFLLQAIDMYSRCLQVSDEFDDSAVIRLCSLWFANFNDAGLQSNFNRALSRVHSRKFVFLAHQLSARLTKPEISTSKPLKNQRYLRALLVRMCNEHPFHSLYQVWALQQGAPQNAPQSSRKDTTRGALDSSVPSSTHGGRASAAADIFAICRQHNAHRVQAIEQLCRAYLEWAKHFLDKDKLPSPLKIPDNFLLRRIRDLPVPVTTVQTPLDHTLRYKDIVTIAHYSPAYIVAGGQNVPKITECIGSDGLRYKQLFKGQGGDDLRQDAVMEQVFELVNVILKRDRHTRKRQLRIRCYKVIPLAPQAGLLEFVTNTMPLGDWLLPGHKRYRPDNVTPAACHKALSEYRAKLDKRVTGHNLEGLHDLFVRLLERFQPVFRHFFRERHKLPMAWFSSRLNYARSVATTSIVGHILGLGDRHTSNILIDHTTGEVVHIDLGIAFDQGRFLNIPELVPFRLTGDIVDGLGTAGTEGVFRRCAEETLRVLRTESGVITTVLEVFRHDPLHSWTASTIRLRRLQEPREGPNMPQDTAKLGVGIDTAKLGVGIDTARLGVGIDMASDAADESADRALTSVHRKLDKSLSVEYTVNELIVSATDSNNLSQIFVGWKPYL